MNKIRKFATTPLRVEECFDFLSHVKSLTQTLPGKKNSEFADIPTPEILESALQQYDHAFTDFDDAIHVTGKISYMTLASEADNERCESWRAINQYVKALLKYPREEVLPYVHEVRSLLKKYGNPIPHSQAERSGILHNLLQELHELTPEKRSAMHLDVWIDDLEARHIHFKEQRRLMALENSERVLGVVKNTRQQADVAYHFLVDVVNALVMTEGIEKYAVFVNTLNEMISRERSLLKFRKTILTRKKEEEETSDQEE